jgi:hypothetical protein
VAHLNAEIVSDKRHPIKEEDDDELDERPSMRRKCGHICTMHHSFVAHFSEILRDKKPHLKVLGKCNKKKKEEPAGENAQLALVSSGICG